MQPIEHKAFALEVKEVGEAGTFVGYGAVFGNKDTYGDVIEAGAFAKSLKSLGSDPLPMLWQHDSREPIGVFTAMSEDAKGLKVEGQLAVPEVRRAVEAHALLRQKALRGLSIGYRVDGPKGAQMDADGTRRLKAIDLVEISLVTVPANPKARVTAVKSLRDLERALRDAGLSREDAKALLAKGAAGLGLRDADVEESASSVLAALRQLREQVGAR